MTHGQLVSVTVDEPVTREINIDMVRVYLERKGLAEPGAPDDWPERDRLAWIVEKISDEEDRPAGATLRDIAQCSA